LRAFVCNFKEIHTMPSGGKRAGAGRPKGVVNRVTAEKRATIEEIARRYTDEAIAVLVDVAKNGASDSARVGAATALLDRGYGRPHQHMDLHATIGHEDALADLE
jgi:hypothetical protein